MNMGILDEIKNRSDMILVDRTKPNSDLIVKEIHTDEGICRVEKNKNTGKVITTPKDFCNFLFDMIEQENGMDGESE